MLGAYKNLVADEDSVFERTFVFEQPDGTPVNLIGWTAELHVLTARDVEITGFPVTAPGNADGEINYTVPNSVMDPIAAGKYQYYIDLVDTQFQKRRFLFGEFHVRPKWVL